jgi:hypothetical protein
MLMPLLVVLCYGNIFTLGLKPVGLVEDGFAELGKRFLIK